MQKVLRLVLVLFIAGTMAFAACGDDDDDNEAGDDDDADDDTGDDDTADDDHRDDDTGDDDADDDADDDDDTEPPEGNVILLQNAKMNLLTQTIAYTDSYFSTSGAMTITEVGTTTGANFSGTLADVGFHACEINFDTGVVQVDLEGDTGLIQAETATGPVVSVPQKSAPWNEGAGAGGLAKGKEEVFNFEDFPQCEGATCVLIAYASVSQVFQVTEFTQGAYSMNDWMLIWGFSGNATAGTVIDLTFEPDE